MELNRQHIYTLFSCNVDGDDRTCAYHPLSMVRIPRTLIFMKHSKSNTMNDVKQLRRLGEASRVFHAGGVHRSCPTNVTVRIPDSTQRIASCRVIP